MAVTPPQNVTNVVNAICVALEEHNFGGGGGGGGGIIRPSLTSCVFFFFFFLLFVWLVGWFILS